MGKKSGFSGFGGSEAARQAQRRHLKKKKSESQRVVDVRRAASDVIGCCFLIAVHDCFGVAGEELQRLEQAISAKAQQYHRDAAAVGVIRAKKLLGVEVCELLPDGFVLPAVKSPRNNQDWRMLGHQREAAETFVMLCVAAARRLYGYGPADIRRLTEVTREIFCEFGEYAASGDYYGFDVLARRLSDVLGEKIDVAEEDDDEPVFGGTLI